MATGVKRPDLFTDEELATADSVTIEEMEHFVLNVAGISDLADYEPEGPRLYHGGRTLKAVLRRCRVAALLAEGLTPTQIAGRLGESTSLICRDRKHLSKALALPGVQQKGDT